VHQASLVDPSLHSPALLELLDIKLTQPVIDYVVNCVVETADYAMGRTSQQQQQQLQPTHPRRHHHLSSPSRPSSPAPQSLSAARRADFARFVASVLSRADVSAAVVLATLVYVDRAKPHLHIALEEWVLERVFLGALIVASKVSRPAQSSPPPIRISPRVMMIDDHG
jgi:hypothetical protein